MKIRTGFVSNSSSSSFLVHANTDELRQFLHLLKKYMWDVDIAFYGEPVYGETFESAPKSWCPEDTVYVSIPNYATLNLEKERMVDLL